MICGEDGTRSVRCRSALPMHSGHVMPKKNFVPQKDQAWIDARKKYHLSHAHIQMARELGMNPAKFGKLANHRQEPWKAPLPVFIESLYCKRFGKWQPDTVRSIEQMVKEQQEKKAAKRRERPPSES